MDNRWDTLLLDKSFRKRTQLEKFDARNPFDNDYYRIVTSASFRRLQDKTQVFPLEQSDYIRTRLTHSIEVSNIGRSIGLSIEKKLIEQKKLSSKHIGYISSLLATVGLVHDIGNPPFGHFGEESIQKYFKKYFKNDNNQRLFKRNKQEIKDFEFFEGNSQTFRILRKLCFLKDEHSLNLTFPTLAAIIKYPRSSITGNKTTDNISDKKFGYFSSEQKDYDIINKDLKINNERHPITYLLEAADDIAYMAADLEDGVKLGILNYKIIREQFSEIKERDNKKLIDKFDEFYKEYSYMQDHELEFAVTRFKIEMQSFMAKKVINNFCDNYDKILDGKFKTDLFKNLAVYEIRKVFKNLAKIVYLSKNITEAELVGCKVITGLLEYYIEAAESDNFNSNGNSKESKLYRTISSSYRYIYENNKTYSNELYNKFQLVLDFISGMTDSYALNLYRKLSGIHN
ncbi:MAG: dNTP triphosphohydrolase [Ignavibacteria bacterium]|nr:dNTP triphosphohydrolase [Ignavibacteria bacterium]